jgi:two-component system, NtrC family, nitrogen regulation sensor histidine kinase NtrY
MLSTFALCPLTLRMLTHDRRILLMAFAAGLPAVATALILLWTGGHTPKVQWTLSVFMLGVFFGFIFAIRDRVVYPLQTISNLLAALREDDFSIRARVDASDALGEVMLEVNALSETLRSQRLGAQEATALLRAVMAEIDVAIFAFDNDQQLVLINRYAERLLGRATEDLLSRRADELGLQPTLRDDAGIQDISFPGGAGRWEVRRTKFWQGGLPHELLVLTDVSQPLREQERQAWRRLIRVIGHELNNSLAPIKSIAGSLEGLLGRDQMPPDWRDDMQRGLAIIASRSDALSRFTAAYARLARLPQPEMKPVRFEPLVHRIAGLERRLPVAVKRGPDLTVNADADQLEQLLINVVRNAVDASLETGGGVAVGWTRSRRMLEVYVDDEGPGLPNTGNLFVPFFTTKPGGSGIGLVLSRQIAEGHGGTLTLENRVNARGCRATLRIPI